MVHFHIIQRGITHSAKNSLLLCFVLNTSIVVGFQVMFYFQKNSSIVFLLKIALDWCEPYSVIYYVFFPIYSQIFVDISSKWSTTLQADCLLEISSSSIIKAADRGSTRMASSSSFKIFLWNTFQISLWTTCRCSSGWIFSDASNMIWSFVSSFDRLPAAKIASSLDLCISPQFQIYSGLRVTRVLLSLRFFHAYQTVCSS